MSTSKSWLIGDDGVGMGWSGKSRLLSASNVAALFGLFEYVLTGVAENRDFLIAIVILNGNSGRVVDATLYNNRFYSCESSSFGIGLDQSEQCRPGSVHK